MGIKVEGHSDLVRDESSNAIVNTNKSAYLMARNVRMKRKDNAMKFVQTARELNSLKSEMHEIKKHVTKTGRG